MTFAAADYRRMYKRFMGPLAQDVVFQINNGTSFDDHPDAIKAHVSRWREDELVAGGTIKIGDLRLVIPYEGNPDFPDLNLNDRIRIEGRSYAIVQWDKHTRTVGPNKVAVDVTVRG